jgi:uncharacterized iron-regulated membrane protein
MSPLKKNILFIHRWLGFISGLVVVIVSITGCLYVFQDEIQDALYDYRKVTVEQKPFMLPSQLRQIAFKYYPKAEKDPTVGYYGKDRPAIVMLSVPKVGLRYISLNPYTGKFLHDENIERNFFVVVEYIHLYLLLPPAIGGQIVGWSVVVFVVLLITGIILWWPKRKSDRKRSLTIKWNGRWRRVNYDLHNVLGFYACSVALILALTGLSICFDWFTKGVNKAVNLGQTYAAEERISVSDSLHKPQVPVNAWDKGFLYAVQHTPNAQMIIIYGDTRKAAGTITVNAYYDAQRYYRGDTYDFDQFTAKPLKELKQQAKSPGLKLNDMNYDIHVGQILGLPTKIIAFLASLICASLPVTGFVIWWGKRNKKGKKVKEVVHRRTHHKQVVAKV